jgi:hypothetical protein
MLTERPLASLPREHAEQFIRALFAPGQWFARAYHHYYRNVLKHNEPTAKLDTHIELARATAKLLANLDDPCLYVVFVGDQPVGIFGYRELRAHSAGAHLASVIATSSLAARCPGPLGIAHCLGILENRTHLELLKHLFVAFVRKANDAGHRQLCFFTADHRLESMYSPFGMEFPADLAMPASKHLVGLFDLARCENRIRIALLEHELTTEQRDVAA